MSSKITLFDDSSDDEEKEKEKLAINKSYAKNYDRWREKEEYEKLKAKYGEEDVDTDSESSSDNDGFGEADNPEFDMDFFRVLAAIKLKHPVLNEDRKFFKDAYESKSKEKEEKPMRVRDFERKLVVERGGRYEDEDEDDEYDEGTKEFPIVNGLNVEVVKGKKVTFDDNLSDSDGEGTNLFKKRERRPEEEGPEENEAVEFLKGKKKSLKNKLDEELLTGLKKTWESSSMSNEDKYLMDYFVNQRYLEEENEDAERAPNHFTLDIESLEDDEKTFDQMEEYETKFRFRYEEPDEEFIKRYPRVIDDSMRNKDAKRKDARDKKKLHKEEEEEKRRQEIKRLKALKKKEILEKIERLKEVSGKNDADFDQIDLNDDFDPAAHDAAMAAMFDDDYYNAEENQLKPECEDEELNREINEEYEKLEELNSITEAEGTYRYRDVFPNNYGLSMEEILFAKDAELNKWMSMKTILRHNLDDVQEKRILKNYTHRASIEAVKKKIFPSLFAENIEEQLKNEQERKRLKNLKKKERKMKKQQEQEAIMAGTSKQQEQTANVTGDTSGVALNEKNNITEKKVISGEKSMLVNDKNINDVNNYYTNESRKRKREKFNKNYSNYNNNNTSKRRKYEGWNNYEKQADNFQGLGDERLAAYGESVKKLKRIVKYGKNNNKQ